MPRTHLERLELCIDKATEREVHKMKREEHPFCIFDVELWGIPYQRNAHVEVEGYNAGWPG